MDFSKVREDSHAGSWYTDNGKNKTFIKHENREVIE